MAQKHNFCGTYFRGVTIENWQDLAELLFQHWDSAIVSLEQCPTTDALHLQYVCRSNEKITKNKALALFRVWDNKVPLSLYVTPCKGTFKQNYAYVSKNTTHISGPLTFGDVPYVADCTLIQADPRCRIFNPPSLTRQILWLCGEPNTGKSYFMRIVLSYLYGTPYQWPSKQKASQGRWLGEYEQQAFVIIDEFNPDQFGEDELKMILDRGKQTIPKSMGGKSVEFDPMFMLLISNHAAYEVEHILRKNPALLTRIRAVYTNFNLFYSQDLTNPICKIL